MDIKLFAYSLLGLSILSFFAKDSVEYKKVEKKDRAFITFEQPIMYTLNEDKVSRIVKAKEVRRFKDRDEMDYATIIFSDPKNNKDEFHIMSADAISKKENIFSFNTNVKYSKENFLTLLTDEFIYDMDKKIAYNNSFFRGIYKGHELEGNGFVFNQQESLFNANKTHFEINLKENR